MTANQKDEELSKNLLFNEPNVKDQDALDGNFKKYLLRDPDFTDEDIGELEEKMLDDERYFERMMLVEDELIEDHLRGALSPDEAQRFNNYFLVTPERKKKLESIKFLASSYIESPKTVAAIGEAQHSDSPKTSWWKSISAFFDSSNLFSGVATAAVLLFLSLGAIWWISQNGKTNDSLIAKAPTNQSLKNINSISNLNQTEIGRNNENEMSAVPQSSPADSPLPVKTPRSVQTPKQVETPKPTPVAKPAVNASTPVVFALFPGILRGEGNAAEGKIKPNNKSVKLDLRLDLEKNYEDFLVVIEDSNGTEIAKRANLKKAKNKESLSVEFPSEKFKPDDYTVRLSGKMNGEYVTVSRYSFRILK